MIDAPRGAHLEEGEKERTRLGFQGHWAELITSAHGAVTAKKRLFLLARKSGGNATEAQEKVAKDNLFKAARDKPESMEKKLLPIGGVSFDAWVDPTKWKLEWDPGMATTGERLLPWTAGKMKDKETGDILLVRNPRGPAPTMRCPRENLLGYGGGLIRDIRGDEGGVRCLEPLEVWRMAGFNTKIGMMAFKRALEWRSS